ncbi:hypothetical protein EDB19DRAFT_1828040 [Suillus lakei]|nr:hypothetical protein EDB19DRAFT_1828040 [Suillus lakei]
MAVSNRQEDLAGGLTFNSIASEMLLPESRGEDMPKYVRVREVEVLAGVTENMNQPPGEAHGPVLLREHLKGELIHHIRTFVALIYIPMQPNARLGTAPSFYKHNLTRFEARALQAMMCPIPGILWPKEDPYDRSGSAVVVSSGLCAGHLAFTCSVRSHLICPKAQKFHTGVHEVLVLEQFNALVQIVHPTLPNLAQLTHIDCGVMSVLYSFKDGVYYIHKEIHNHPKQTHDEWTRFEQIVFENPATGPAALIAGRHSLTGTRESVATISTDRVKAELQALPGKSTRNFVDDFAEFQRNHPGYVLYSRFEAVTVVVVQTPFMVSQLTNSIEDVAVNDIVSNTALGFWRIFS